MITYNLDMDVRLAEKVVDKWGVVSYQIFFLLINKLKLKSKQYFTGYLISNLNRGF